MKVFGFVPPKALIATVSTVLGLGVLTTGIVAAVPQARIGLQGMVPIVRRVPAIGPAAGLTYRVEGPSMEPAFTSGQYITMLPLIDGRPQPCDVVAFHATPNAIYLKRVIAIGPATVTWTSSAITVSGPYVCAKYQLTGSIGSPAQTHTRSVPADDYFVIGDNLPNSADSRIFGPILRNSIVAYLPA